MNLINFFKKTKSTNNKKSNTLFKVTHPKFSPDLEKHLKDGIYWYDLIKEKNRKFYSLKILNIYKVNPS